MEEFLLELFSKGHNFAICGQAGTGKSFMLRKLHQMCIEKGLHVCMTGTTGIATTVLSNGKTLHRYTSVSFTHSFIKKTGIINLGIKIIIQDNTTATVNQCIVRTKYQTKYQDSSLEIYARLTLLSPYY